MFSREICAIRVLTVRRNVSFALLIADMFNLLLSGESSRRTMCSGSGVNAGSVFEEISAPFALIFTRSLLNSVKLDSVW